jgi:hypothetical protein
MVTSKPTEMELRVAEAIKSVDDSKPKGGLGASYLSLARAAIRAMRTPTTEMLRDALIGMPVRTEPAAAIWEVLIDAASPQD